MLPWGMIAGGVGLGASALGSMFDKETPGEIGANWLQNPQYGYTQGNMQNLSNYYNQGLSNLQAGKAPQWYQQYEQAKKPRQQQDLYQTYYGGNWGPGIMDTMKSYNAQRGTPAGQKGNLYGKQLSDYANQSQQIDEFFNAQGANAMQQSEGQYLQGMRNLPEGPSGQWQQWQTQPSYEQSWLSKAGQGLIGMAPYANEMMGSFGQGKQPVQSGPIGYKGPAQGPYGQGLNPVQMGDIGYQGAAQGPWPFTQSEQYTNPQSFSDMTKSYLGQNFGWATQGMGQNPSYTGSTPWAPYSTQGTYEDSMNRNRMTNQQSWNGYDTSSPWMPTTPTTAGWPNWMDGYYNTVVGGKR